tara:strand:+ start:472 stop:654 length:183 start_codon:yes stop_codon:yes gene_type:complete
MKVRYKITQENGLYKIQKWFGNDCDGEIDSVDLIEILAYQLHGDQLVGKTQRMIERFIKK